MSAGELVRIAGADDALMLDMRGFVAETNATHVFVVEKGRLRTPHCHACPEGITRATVLELCAREGLPAEPADLSTTELYRADEMFCTGTMGELAAIRSLDGRRIGEEACPGPVCERLSALYAAEVRSAGEWILEPERTRAPGD